jgi:hypothetical protein
MSFPSSPSSGQTAVVNNITYLYSTSTQAWTRVAGQVTATTYLNVVNNTPTNSTITGALQVVGGVGIGGGLFVGGAITATSFVGAFIGSGVISTATNLFGGTAGQLVYQTGPGATGFAGPGTAGQVLVSNGAGAPTYNNVLTLAGTTAATSTTSGALQVVGGVGIGGDVWAGNIVTGPNQYIHFGGTTGTRIYRDGGSNGMSLQTNSLSRLFISDSGPVTVLSTASSTSTTTGALQVVGGVGIGGGLYVGGAITATSFVGAFIGSGVISTATNIAGGLAGQLVYQTAPGATGFVNTSAVQVGYATTAGFAASFNTGTLVATAVNFLNTASTQVGYATTASNIAGGTAGQLHYQTGPGATGFVGPGTSGNVLVSNGTSAPTYNNTLTLTGTTAATSTATGALQVRGGVGIGGNTWIGGAAIVSGGNIDLRNSTTSSIVMASLAQQGNNVVFEFGRTDVANTPAIDFHSSGANTDYDVRIQANGGNTATIGQARLDLIANQVYLSSTQTTISAITGALRVDGGVGIGGGLYVGGTVTATSFVGTFIGSGAITTATNLLGGTAGQLHYQTGPGATGFAGPGTAGQVLVSAGTSAPVYTNTASIYVGRAVLSDSATTATVSTQVQTVLQPANGTYYPTFVDANSATATGKSVYTTSTFIIDPLSGYIKTGNSITMGNGPYGPDPGAAQLIMCGSNSMSGTGAKIIMGYGNNTSGILTGEGPNTWNINVAGGTQNNNFKIIRYPQTGGPLTCAEFTESTGGVQLVSVGVGTAPSSVTGEIRASNEITAYYSSDARLKENVVKIDNPMEKLNQIRGVHFDWTDETIKVRGGEDGYFVRKHDIGVIAQEVEAVLPEIVATRDDGFKAVKYEKLVPLLIEAIKTLEERIRILEGKLRS